MAGIGFRLERIFSKNSYVNLLEGYAYSAMVSTGPLICTIFTIAAIMLLMPGRMAEGDLLIFRTLVVYIYGFSLISTSFVQMVITRYMSDRIFLHDTKALVPAFVGTALLTLIVHTVIGVAALPGADLDLRSSVVALILLLEISIIWIAMIILSAAKKFTWVTIAFALGSIVSVGAGFALGNSFGLVGLLSGFAAGQALLVALLIAQIFAEFEYRPRVEFRFLSYFRQYTALAFIAVFYNIGIWVDKWVFWFSSTTGERIHGFLFASSIYDVPVFVAYLFVIPSLAMFTVRIETDFYVHYKKFFLAILEKHPLFSTEERHRNILQSLKTSMARLIVLQTTVTLFGLMIAPAIFPYLGMTPIHLGVFHIAILATFLQALMLSMLIIILYFDFRMDALFLAILFAATNLLFSWLTVRLGFAWYGYGYFGSCLVSLLAGFIILNHRLKHLLYYTFVSQKIITHRQSQGGATA